jgi:serine/threonine protein kinase/tetratricopeptide (TPR) repeat protein
MESGARFGPYELQALLGRGGMGEVWEAVLHGPRGFLRSVALKVAGEAFSAERDGLLREARLGGLLCHPNVVAIHEVGEIDGRLFIAMDLVQGVPASALLSLGPLPPRALASVGLQAARGLHHCHDLEIDGVRVGLVHRDIKPRNLLVDRHGCLRVADLGIARLRSAAEPAGAEAEVAGTLGFMPPEQASGLEDSRADLFALGVSLVMLGTMQLPFEPKLLSPDEVRRALWGQPPWLRFLEERAAPLVPIVLRCLAPEPRDRFPTAQALADELAALRLPGPDLGALVAQYLGRTAQSSGPVPSVSSVSSGPASQGLPSLSGELFGRGQELGAILERVREQEPLVVLTGPGGVGKTRLSLELARAMAGELPGGIWFCDLSGAKNEAQLYLGIAKALQIPLEAEPLAGLGRALRGRGRCLLVLDPVEQVLREATSVVRHLLHAAPEATLLVTSRVALRIPEELLLTLGPLPTDAGMALFLDRCGALDPAELSLVQEIVEQLDGLPLAIELAASSLGVAVHDGALLGLRARLAAGLARLEPRPASSQDDLDRALRASFAASAALLGRWERLALAQWAVFCGAFSVEAAGAVLDRRDWPAAAPSAVAILATLVDHSVVRAEGDGRFRVIPVLRAVASEARTPEERASDEARHAAWFDQYGHRDALEALHRRGGEERRQKLPLVLDDLAAAARRTGAPGAALAAWVILRDSGPVELALELLQAALAKGRPERRVEVQIEVAAALQAMGRAEQGHAALQEVLALDDSHPRKVRALVVKATLYRLKSHFGEAHRLLQRALELAQRSGDEWELAVVRANQGALLQRQEEPQQAADVLQEALAGYEAQGDLRGEANVRNVLALALRDLGRRDEALEQLEQTLALARRIGSLAVQARALGNLGVLRQERGELELAERLYQDALALHQRVGQGRSVAITSGNLAVAARRRGDLVAAIGYAEASVEGHREGGDLVFLGHALGGLGNVLRDSGRPTEALVRFDEALDCYQRAHAWTDAVQVLRNSSRCSRTLGDLQDEVSRLARALGLCEPQKLAVERVRARIELVLACYAAGQVPRARAELRLAAEEVLETADAYAAGMLHLARAAMLPGDDPLAHHELQSALVRLEPVKEPTPQAACWIELAARCEGEQAHRALATAEALLDGRPVPELLRLLAIRAQLEPHRPELREALLAKARALGVPEGVDLDLVVGSP